MDIESIIRKKLLQLNEDYDSLKPSLKNWLFKVENEIQHLNTLQDKALDDFKSTDYSVKGISKRISSSRTTMYNHGQLLKRYIELSAQEANDKNPYCLISQLREEKAMLNRQLLQMMNRDIDVQLLMEENARLTSTLKDKDDVITRLQSRVAELSSGKNITLKRHH